MATENQTSLSGSGQDTRSKVDLILGIHTNSIIVAILIIIIFCGFLYLVVNIKKENMHEGVVTGIIGLLSGLVGFYAGSAKKNSD